MSAETVPAFSFVAKLDLPAIGAFSLLESHESHATRAAMSNLFVETFGTYTSTYLSAKKTDRRMVMVSRLRDDAERAAVIRELGLDNPKSEFSWAHFWALFNPEEGEPCILEDCNNLNRPNFFIFRDELGNPWVVSAFRMSEGWFLTLLPMDHPGNFIEGSQFFIPI